MSKPSNILYHSLGWFCLVNLAVFTQASLSLSVLGLDEWLNKNGQDMLDVSLGLAVLGSLGALLMSLASRPIIRFFLKARVADDTMSTKVQQLRLIIARQASQAGLSPPLLAIYPSDESNAFAIGSSREHAMLVVSQHLLDSLSLDELSAVVGHELTHIANGDMVTLSLMQGVVNICVHFPAHVLGMGLDSLLVENRHKAPVTRTISSLLLLLFGGLASLIVMWFSRHREFSADAGGAKLAGYGEMMAALRSLQSNIKNEPAMYPFAVFGLNGQFMHRGILRLFSSHPSIEERIQVLAKNR